ncbi:GNAT family N-acetyltransferase [Bacillus sp. AFS017336]|uniref:GNAT family N-acetyltransferase n=1 Tax=Bacillus sp. AFS017336 TaxID=2033489 RepID=UPI000BF05316|nr:GNAT family N-acetyltransferase [Bacillus sp. AFS017336]PEL08146.1 GNAT family N-acetyltransferase [Bacillus sp. AFS017336]
MKFIAFENRHLDEAASLLANRHMYDRNMNPELSPKFEGTETAKKAIEVLFNEKNSFGVAAINDSKLVGYMIGSIHTDKNRERHTWVKYAGMAIAESESTELYRELYAEFARKMVENGSFNHYVMVPSGNKSALDAWLHLGFAYEQVHAIRDLSVSTDRVFSDVQIRVSNNEDEKRIRELATVIMEHQAKSPVFAPGFIEEREDYQEGYAELINDETATLWLALYQNEIVGFQVFESAEASDENLLTPESCISLVVGATVESSRGKGVSTALLDHGLTFAKKEGYQFCETDWRITNLESSRFWSKNGFKPIAYRLVRKIDPRILWATGI